MGKEVIKIGIAISSHNRPEVSRQTFDILDKLRPKNSLIGLVDDASINPPFGFSNSYINQYRFERHVGVSMVKNKCLELLYSACCTHFFLFDDDCRPVLANWWKPYINSRLEHATWTFDRPLVSEVENQYREFEKPNGCMMYFTRTAVNTIGGWDMSFTGYGYEHVNVSDRAFNAGLTPRRYVDVWHNSPLFELADCQSSFTPEDRACIPSNFKLYQEKYLSKEFKPFK
ncbi:hypothetical protein [Mucilaginibacter xinganensis]|uniref:N-terminal domain of galactosyltransferase n=1 Tax=Mucilaginibacter xinganensis TaxID=1234841 RepID=A0A223NX20_9SPHI|nr:hypothetical protein [Mucilaginibacter xinganensis]ASU34405.1 N-terminal domain of galactosyltransferase [Mucilaginibacter xinganensis]